MTFAASFLTLDFVKCLLCQSQDVQEIPLSAGELQNAKSLAFSGVLWHCQCCDLIFKDPQFFLNLSEQKSRYDNHHNSIEDQGYVNTFMPVLQAVTDLFADVNQKEQLRFLDWGSGPEPVLAQLFKQRFLLDIEIYDPVYAVTELGPKKYDLITCTEVVEHMTDPLRDFKKIDEHLKSGAYFIGLTNFYPRQDFRKWWYVRDLTHVIFFSEKTFNYLASCFLWQTVKLQSPLFVLKKL